MVRKRRRNTVSLTKARLRKLIAGTGVRKRRRRKRRTPKVTISRVTYNKLRSRRRRRGAKTVTISKATLRRLTS